jgi:hypothetical protein
VLIFFSVLLIFAASQFSEGEFFTMRVRLFSSKKAHREKRNAATDKTYTANSTTERNSEMGDSAALTTFKQFSELNEDLRRHVVSFVSDAPLEQDLPGPLANRFRPASLTSSLPFVSKQFYAFANLEEFWEAALVRQLKKNRIWIQGVRRLLPDEASPLLHNDETTDAQQLLESVRQCSNPPLTCKEVYRLMVTRHIKCIGPIFVMPCPVSLGEPYGLHLFEPRYRLMIHDLMERCDNPEQARNGAKIRPRREDGMVQPPLLIHACRGARLGEGEMACLVQVVYCQTYEYGTADVQLLPVAWVRLEKIWVRPSSGNLYYAKATRA